MTNFYLPAGNYTVCETDSKIDPNSSGWSSNPWSSTVPDGCMNVTVSLGGSIQRDFGNAIGNLNCNGQLTTSDGVVVTRLNNTDNSACFLKPATLTSSFGNDGDLVTFLASDRDGRVRDLYIFSGVGSGDHHEVVAEDLAHPSLL
jgi:hypothetical protein